MQTPGLQHPATSSLDASRSKGDALLDTVLMTSLTACSTVETGLLQWASTIIKVEKAVAYSRRCLQARPSLMGRTRTRCLL